MSNSFVLPTIIFVPLMANIVMTQQFYGPYYGGNSPYYGENGGSPYYYGQGNWVDSYNYRNSDWYGGNNRGYYGGQRSYDYYDDQRPLRRRAQQANPFQKLSRGGPGGWQGMLQGGFEGAMIGAMMGAQGRR